MDRKETRDGSTLHTPRGISPASHLLVRPMLAAWRVGRDYRLGKVSEVPVLPEMRLIKVLRQAQHSLNVTWARLGLGLQKATFWKPIIWVMKQTLADRHRTPYLWIARDRGYTLPSAYTSCMVAFTLEIN